MSEDKSAADKMVKDAEEKITSRFPPWGGRERKEAGVDLLKKAATYYKLNREWEAAAKAYLRAADVSAQIENASEASSVSLLVS